MVTTKLSILPPAGNVSGHNTICIRVAHMKVLARSFVWCPWTDCQSFTTSCSFATLSLGCELMQTINEHFLITVDAHSKWIEVRPVNSTTSTVTIDHLHLIFATYTWHNGFIFTSDEFGIFTKQIELWYLPCQVSTLPSCFKCFND